MIMKKGKNIKKKKSKKGVFGPVNFFLMHMIFILIEILHADRIQVHMERWQ